MLKCYESFYFFRSAYKKYSVTTVVSLLSLMPFPALYASVQLNHLNKAFINLK